MPVRPLRLAAVRSGPPEGRVGIVDVGSNSIRLVVYDGLARSPVPIFNEKALCGLARALPETGRLDPQGIDHAIRTISRFLALASAMNVSPLHVVATAAVRDAADGSQFVDRVERELGVTIRVLSGEEEAQLVGAAVAATIPMADGIVGDIGGGSLELVEVKKGRVENAATLPLGVLRFDLSSKQRIKAAVKTIDQSIAAVPWLENLADRTLYPVGGAWRAFARLDMAWNEYPLQVIDHYVIRRTKAAKLIDLVKNMSPGSLEKITAVGARRRETLRPAALVLDRILAVGRPRELVFAAAGLREGLLFDLLPEAEREADPLIAGCRQMAEDTGRFGGHGRVLFDWVRPLFGELSPRWARAVEAACWLTDIAWRDHPQYRADAAYRRALHMSVVGLDHPGRVFVALALYHRYGASWKQEPPLEVRELLGEEEIESARKLGLALRLAMSLSGGAAELVGRTRLVLRKKLLGLEYEEEIESLVGEVAEKRMAALAELFGREVEIRPMSRRDPSVKSV